jgi:hypothetical protein
MIEQVELDITDLLLDVDNPRLGSVSSQSAALESLIELNSSHFRNMMLSIKEHGLDPGDSLYVIESDEHDGEYTVLDGNRRVSALMVLENTALLNGISLSDNLKKSLVRAAKGFNSKNLPEIRGILFEDRADANAWIARRHTGIANGEGRINWGTLEIQRFSGDRSVLDILDFVGRSDVFDAEEWATTKSVIESSRSSTLSRLLESKAGREHLGVQVIAGSQGKHPALSSKPKWALSVLKRIIEDVRDGVIDTRNLNSSSEIKDYLNALPIKLKPSDKTKGTLTEISSINLQPSKPKTVLKPTIIKTTRSKQKRITLAPKKHEFNQPTSTKGQMLVREAETINVNKFPLASAYLLRALLELAIDQYMKDQSIPRSEKNAKDPKKYTELNLQARADKVIKHATAAKLIDAQDARGIRNKLTQRSDPASIQSLNSYHHNKYQIPTSDTLRVAWDSAVPLFNAVFGAI